MLKLLFTVLFFPLIAFADDASLISVEGLSFECTACRKTDSNFCEVPWQGKTLTVVCDSLFEVLLQRAHEEHSLQYPKNEELLAFLSRKEIDSALINTAFELLYQRRIDQRLLNTALEILLSKHLEVIKNGIARKSFNEDVKLSLWAKRNRLPLKESFLLAKILPGKGVDAFLQDLSVVDAKQDSKIISELINNNISVGLESQIFSALLQFIENCSQKLECENLSSSFSSEAIKYTYRLQNSVISKAVIGKKISGLSALSLLAKIKYLDHRTPETHQALILLLNDLGSFEQVWKKLPLAERDFISFMSRNDSRIAELVYHQASWGWLDWSIATSLSIIASGMALFIFSKRRAQVVFSETLEFKKDLEEFNAIWSFFDLSPDSNLRDLKRRYREMARELHPDSGREDSEEFVRLNNYYQQAIKLFRH